MDDTIWFCILTSSFGHYSRIDILSWPQKRKKGTEETDFENKSLPMNLCARYIETSFTLFQFALDIMGSVWVLGKYGDWDDAGQPNCNGLRDDSDKCCHEGMFLFALI